jgi:hypothetical protein
MFTGKSKSQMPSLEELRVVISSPDDVKDERQALAGPDANSAITAAIATMLKVIPVFEFINKCYD